LAGVVASRTHFTAAMFGVAVGLSGVFVIAAPSLHLEKKIRSSPTACLWAGRGLAISIVFVRSHRFAATTIAPLLADAGGGGSPSALAQGV